MIIDQQIIIIRNRLSFYDSLAEALVHNLLLVSSPSRKPSLEFSRIGRSDKDQRNLRIFLSDLHGALDFDLQQHIPPGIHVFFHKSPGSSIVVIRVSRVLQETVIPDQFFKDLVGDKMIFNAVSLTLSGLAGRHRHGEHISVVLLPHTADHCPFSRSAEAGNHNQFSSHDTPLSISGLAGESFGPALPGIIWKVKNRCCSFFTLRSLLHRLNHPQTGHVRGLFPAEVPTGRFCHSP